MRTGQLAIGVISCERGAITQRCLDFIRSCTVAPYHIYVVDNGSRSETPGRTWTSGKANAT